MRYLRTFLKRWYLYIIPMILFPIVTTMIGYNALMLYRSSALLYVDKPVFLSTDDFGWNSWLSPAENQAESMRQLMGSETFVAQIAAKTDLAETLDLSTQVGKDSAFARIGVDTTIVSTGTGPNTITLAVTDKNPHMAAQIAQGALDVFATYYQSHRLSLDKDGITFYQQQLQSAQSTLAQDSAKLQEYLNRHPEAVGTNGSTDPTLATLQQQVNQDQSSVTTFNAQIASLRQDQQAAATGSSSFLRVLDPPDVPLRPTLQKKKLVTTYTGGGLAAAAGLDALIVIVLTLLDRKIYFVQDFRKIEEELDIDLPTIEMLPIIPEISGGRRQGHFDDERDDIDGILVPVLTALPRMRPSEMQANLKRMAGVRDAMAGKVDGEHDR
jgi:uncharacterized protein involved in exopolysaccharide biosynthesis